MTVDFNDYFWGEKNNGFDVLYHNMKYGFQASKEFSEFLRERSNIEENNSKLFAKLAKQAGSCCAHGTFSPVWQILKNSSEKFSALHIQMVQKVSDLVKEVTKYADDIQKKHKSVKEEEEGTLRKVQAMQAITVAVQKSKENLNQRGIELEKLRKDNASPKEIEKAEVKYKKTQEDHKNYIEKYTTTKEEFEKKMCVTCKNFQELEVTHLIHMKEFLNSYVEVVDWTHEEIGKVHAEFRQQCIELTVDQLLEQFVRDKSTGLDKPGLLNFEEPVLPITSPTQEVDNSKSRTKREGFLRSRRDKAKQKKAKKKSKDSLDNQSNKDEKSDMEEKEEPQPTTAPVEPDAPEVDDEGYIVRPNPPQLNSEKGSFYSSSDTDSDEDREPKLHVKIKPLTHNGAAPMSASVDELRATVENLYLSPVGSSFGRRGSNIENQDMAMKRSQSVSQQIGKPSGDLLGLNFIQSPTASNASTPTSSHPYAPLQSPSQLALNSPTLSASSRYAEIGDLFSEDNEVTSASNRQQTRQISSTSTYMSIPRPPSRRSDPAKSLVPQSNISRTDSINSLEFRTSCVAVGTSRGPSPLTIGMADTIPLAVAFHEMVHSYFRGADETRCQVKMSGEMMLSFPAGIVTILAHNPNPAKLIFHVKNTQRLMNVLPNNKLVTADIGQSSEDLIVIEFNMNALSTLLKKQSEQNPSASYFNVDILKYQIKPNPGATSCPFQLVAYWKCTNLHTDLKIDYKYNSHAMASPSPLLNIRVAVPMEEGMKSFQSKPAGQWCPESKMLLWRFPEFSLHSENNAVGSILARIDVPNGPSRPSTISTSFNCEGTTLSGIDFQLVGPGYRLSLVKRRFVSGKYICDGDLKIDSGTPSTGSAAPSNVSSSGDPNC